MVCRKDGGPEALELEWGMPSPRASSCIRTTPWPTLSLPDKEATAVLLALKIPSDYSSSRFGQRLPDIWRMNWNLS